MGGVRCNSCCQYVGHASGSRRGMAERDGTAATGCGVGGGAATRSGGRPADWDAVVRRTGEGREGGSSVRGEAFSSARCRERKRASAVSSRRRWVIPACRQGRRSGAIFSGTGATRAVSRRYPAWTGAPNVLPGPKRQPRKLYSVPCRSRLGSDCPQSGPLFW